MPGPDARAGGGVAGHAVARGDVRIGAVVDVEQRALRAFEQQVVAGAVRVVQIAQPTSAIIGASCSARAHRLVEHRLEVERLGAAGSSSSTKLCSSSSSRSLVGEALGMLQVLHAQRAARDLVFVGRADAAAGGADLAGAAASRAAPRARCRAPTWNGRISGHDSLMRRRERTSTPVFSSRSISVEQVRRSTAPRRCRCSRRRRRA